MDLPYQHNSTHHHLPSLSSSLSTGSNRMAGVKERPPLPPTQDWARLVKDVKLSFSILTPAGTLAATVHLYITTCKFHMQGVSPCPTSPVPT